MFLTTLITRFIFSQLLNLNLKNYCYQNFSREFLGGGNKLVSLPNFWSGILFLFSVNFISLPSLREVSGSLPSQFSAVPILTPLSGSVPRSRCAVLGVVRSVVLY